jgi:hypothetical protein
LTERAGRIEVTLGAETFGFAAHKVDRVRVDGGEGLDTFAIDDLRLDPEGRGRARPDRFR